MILTDAELQELTKRERPKAQARALRAMGIPFRVHPTDNALQVAKSAAEAYLGVAHTASNDEPEQGYAVNVIALRAKHGTKAQAR